MVVCVCHAVCEREVRDAIEGGAASVAEVTQTCRAGGDCGACHATIHQMISQEIAQGAERQEESGPLPRLVALRTRAA
jgi:bacterioferritin-associated ferredoxin